MERFFGFDLGDAESAVSVLPRQEQAGSRAVPEVLTVRDARSFITAYARLTSGELLIGESACYNPDAVERKLRFKSRFLTDRTSAAEIRTFAAGVLGDLYTTGSLVQNEDCCFYIGCPAGWDKRAREQYRQIFEKVGYPPTRIISESRAALVSACQSKHLQVGYDILSQPVLVVDIGSSTTDFAYIAGGREVELKTGGEVFLGGGVLDALILEEALAESRKGKKIREIFEKSEPWRSYCEFAARRLKEKYFSDEDYWKDHACTQTVRISYDFPLRLTLRMDEQIADRILNRPAAALGGRSFRQVFTESLAQVRGSIEGQGPFLIFLTGGVSRMPEIPVWCQEAFPDAVIITGAEPEFSVSRGLAWCGSIDEQLREFMKDIENLRASTRVEQIVAERIDDLYRRTVDILTDPILDQVVLPVVDRWRDGQIERLCDINDVLQEEIAAWLRTDEARELLAKPVSAWIRPVAYALERETIPICVRHGVPYKAMSLSSYLSVSDIDIRLDARDVFAVEQMTWMIDAIISILISLFCGGSGVALIAEGLPGLVAGSVISMMILLLGMDRMQDMLLKANIPGPVRKLMPRSLFESRKKKIGEEIRTDFYRSLGTDRNEEITQRLVQDISTQIDTCLIHMAQVVEIPLGQ